MEGYIHSVETFGTLDGPGIRYVVFFQGCPLRCKYCHNPDTWSSKGGKKVTAAEIVEDILKYKNYMSNGGVTLSGGEPLLQPEFAAEILRICKENGIHTAIDTSGSIPLNRCKSAIDLADLVLLDIKSIDNAKCRDLTGMGNDNTFELLEYLKGCEKRVWIRHVVVPQITENYSDIDKMAKYLSEYSIIDRVEILPFHKMGEYKWKELGIKYSLDKIREPSTKSIAEIKNIFKKYRLHVA